MSNFQNPYQKISWLERRLNAVESMVRKFISPGGVTNTGTSGGPTVLGVIQTHNHRGTGGGGALDYKGTGEITALNTSVTITHGCGFTPTIQQITVTPSQNTTNAVGLWWVDTIGATTFAVNVAAAPGATTFKFGWRVSPT